MLYLGFDGAAASPGRQLRTVLDSAALARHLASPNGMPAPSSPLSRDAAFSPSGQTLGRPAGRERGVPAVKAFTEGDTGYSRAEPALATAVALPACACADIAQPPGNGCPCCQCPGRASPNLSLKRAKRGRNSQARVIASHAGRIDSSCGPASTAGRRWLGSRPFRAVVVAGAMSVVEGPVPLTLFPPPAPQVIDLFAGAGGLTVGFRAAGFDPVFAVEIDRAAAETYRVNFDPHGVVSEDPYTKAHVYACPIEKITSFPRVDVVIGGPPCQGFSPLGRDRAHDERVQLNELWRQYLRVVRDVQPKVFVVENVPEFLKSDQFAEFLKAIEEDPDLKDYQVEYRVLKAVEYGVPQTRRRGIVIGSRVGPPSLAPEEPRPGGGPAQWLRDGPGVDRRPAGKADRCGPALGPEPETHVDRAVPGRPEGGNRFDLARNRPDLLPNCWRNKPSGTTDVFGRLWWERPAFTIRTEFFKPEKGRYLHPSRTGRSPIARRPESRRFRTSSSSRARRSRLRDRSATPCRPCSPRRSRLPYLERLGAASEASASSHSQVGRRLGLLHRTRRPAVARRAATTSEIRCAALVGSSCSHTRTTTQPEPRKIASVSRSRSPFRSIFCRQKPAFDLGQVPCSGHPCQKQPSTNTATRATRKDDVRLT